MYRLYGHPLLQQQQQELVFEGDADLGTPPQFGAAIVDLHFSGSLEVFLSHWLLLSNDYIKFQTLFCKGCLHSRKPSRASKNIAQLLTPEFF
jgi:hypothetical protein